MGQGFMMGLKSRKNGYYAYGVAPLSWFKSTYVEAGVIYGYTNHVRTYTISGIGFEPKTVRLVNHQIAHNVMGGINLLILDGPNDYSIMIAKVASYGYQWNTKNWVSPPIYMTYDETAKTVTVKISQYWSSDGTGVGNALFVPEFTMANNVPDEILWYVTG